MLTPALGGADAVTPSRRWLLTVAAAFLASVAGPLPSMMVGALAPQMSTDLGFSTSGLGAVMAMYFAMSAAVSAAVGRRLESAGWQRGVLVAVGGTALWLAMIAVFARNWVLLAVLLVGAGLTNAVAHPAANQSLSEMPSNRIGVLFGFKQSAIPLSSLLAGMSLPVLAVRMGWRFTMGAAAVALTLLSAMLTVALSRRTAVGGKPIPAEGTILDRASRRQLLLLTSATALGTAATYASSAFFVTYAVYLSLPVGRAGLFLSLGSLSAIVVRVLAGWIVDRLGKISFLAPAAVLAVGTVSLAVTSLGNAATLGALAVVMFGSIWGWTGLFNAAVVQAYPRAVAMSTSITQVGVYVGAGAGPLLFGLVAESVSFEVAWLTLIPLAAGGSMLMLICDNRSRLSR